MAKTIKQIADEMGVSKQAVFKKIDNLGLRDKLTKNGNQFMVDEDVEMLLKQGSPENDRKQVDVNDTSTVNTLIDMLQRELDSKNKIIEEQAQTIKKQAESIDKLTESLSAAQALHAGTIQAQLQSPADPDPETEEIMVEQQPKKKKWKWPWFRNEE